MPKVESAFYELSSTLIWCVLSYYARIAIASATPNALFKLTIQGSDLKQTSESAFSQMVHKPHSVIDR